MKYKEFKKVMDNLISIKKDEDNLNKAFRKFCPDFNFICFSRQEELIVDLIKMLMGDEDDWIGYWLYELDCGKEAKKNSVQDKDGKNIPIKTLRDLYNIITK